MKHNTEVRFLDQSRGLVLSILPPFIKVIDIFIPKDGTYGEEILFVPGLSKPVAIYMFFEEEVEANKILEQTQSMTSALKILLKKYQCDLWIKPYKYSLIIPSPFAKVHTAVFENLEVFSFNGRPLRK